MRNFDSSNLDRFKLNVNSTDENEITLDITFNYGPTYRYWRDDDPTAAAAFYCALVEAVDADRSVGRVFNELKGEFQYKKLGDDNG